MSGQPRNRSVGMNWQFICLFPPTINTQLYFYVLSTVLRKSKFYTLYIYIYIYIYIHTCILHIYVYISQCLNFKLRYIQRYRYIQRSRYIQREIVNLKFKHQEIYTYMYKYRQIYIYIDRLIDRQKDRYKINNRFQKRCNLKIYMKYIYTSLFSHQKETRIRH